MRSALSRRRSASRTRPPRHTPKDAPQPQLVEQVAEHGPHHVPAVPLRPVIAIADRDAQLGLAQERVVAVVHHVADVLPGRAILDRERPAVLRRVLQLLGERGHEGGEAHLQRPGGVVRREFGIRAPRVVALGVADREQRLHRRQFVVADVARLDLGPAGLAVETPAGGLLGSG
mgnify:CR=1 FL=1